MNARLRLNLWVAVTLGIGASAFAAAGGRLPISLTSAWGVLLLIVVSPILEEWLLRAGLHDALARRWPERSRGWASPITLAVAVVFALAHAAVQWHWQGLLTLMPAWLIGWAYSESRSLGWAMSHHALANAALLTSSLWLSP
jgi:uncharacterized protein